MALRKGVCHLALYLSRRGLPPQTWHVRAILFHGFVFLNSPLDKDADTLPLNGSQDYQNLQSKWILPLWDEDMFLELWWE